MGGGGRGLSFWFGRPSGETRRCSRPRPCRRGLLLVALDLALLLFGQADVVESIEQAVLAVRVDFEMNDTAIGATNFLLLEIDGQRRVGAAISIVEQLLKIVR